MNRLSMKLVYKNAKGGECATNNHAVQSDIEDLIFALGTSGHVIFDTMNRIKKNKDQLIELLKELDDD